MPAPTNTSALTAVSIPSLPYTITQTVDDAGTTYTVWYVYTTLGNEREIGVFGFGDLSVYKPTTDILTGSAASPTLYFSGAINKPLQVPVSPATTYFFRFTPNAGNPTPAVLTVSILPAPTVASVAGAFFVPDDNGGFPAAVISPVTGAVQKFYTFPSCEWGDVTDAGLIVAQDSSNFNTIIYSNQVAQLGTLAFNPGNGIRLNRASQTFYIGNATHGPSGHVAATTVTSAGALGPTAWDLDTRGLQSLCASPTDSILYFGATGAGGAVQRFDLVGNAPLSDLAAGITGYFVVDMLGLPDGSIIVLYWNGGSFLAQAKQYSAAGATVRTFSLGACETKPKLAYALDHPLSFWVWTHSVTHFSTFTNLLVADGSTVSTFTTPEYAQGVYQPTASADPVRFGNANSCPFLVLRASAPVTPTFSTTVDPIRRLRRAPHLWDGTSGHRLTYPGFQLIVESGAPRDNDIPLTFFLRWSDDGGHTWSRSHQLDGSNIGQYRTRFWWRRLGQSRDRVFEVSESNSAKVVLIEALLTPDPVEGAN